MPFSAARKAEVGAASIETEIPGSEGRFPAS
jgi:hypothetical protein